MSKPMHQNEGYMEHMHIKELDFLKRLSIIDGEIYFNTGALLQPISDRIDMYEDMVSRHPDTYSEEINRLEEEKERQREHLRNV